ncbi:hypothetical protein ACFXKD_00135 [Nocardiopsis aegyptia]|uniref:hypothetical protein n=1 Tax=Nocardiopsis aegyptia TaxID=220378 RepID=UPI00366D9301
MSTPSQIAAQAARTRRRLYLAAGLVLLLLAVAGGWFLGRGASDPVEEAPAAPEPSPTSQADGFELLDGGELSQGLPVRFPHTPQGAVSATVHGLHAQSTNDARALAEVLSTYHRADYDAGDIEEGILADRALEMRLNQPDGSDFDMDDFPSPASYHYITPVAVWWQEQDADTVEVAVLADMEASDGAAVVVEGRYIFGRTLVWDEGTRGGDWVVDAVTDPTRTGTRPRPEEYELDHPSWTPIIITGADEGS